MSLVVLRAMGAKKNMSRAARKSGKKILQVAALLQPRSLSFCFFSMYLRSLPCCPPSHPFRQFRLAARAEMRLTPSNLQDCHQRQQHQQHGHHHCRRQQHHRQWRVGFRLWNGYMVLLHAGVWVVYHLIFRQNKKE